MRRSDRGCSGGFTLIEFLVAFGVAALVILPAVALLNSSLRLYRASEAYALAAQALRAPELGEKILGAQTRTVSTEERSLGLFRIRTVLVDIVPTGQTDGVRVRLYR